MTEKNFRKEITTLKLIVGSLVVGQLSFFSIVFFILNEGVEADVARSYPVMAGTIAFCSIIASSLIFVVLMKKSLKPGISLRDKISAYFTASIVKSVLLVAGGNLCIVLYLLSANKLTLIPFVICLMALLFAFPRESKIAIALGLSEEEERRLN